MIECRPPGHLVTRITGAIAAAALLAGCAGLADMGIGKPGRAAMAAGDSRAVARAERAVARGPADPATRAALGRAYLAGGRFASAVAAFDDALQLGENGAATVIGLALAEIGSGNSQAAVQLLEDWRDVLPASDRGLALALAGEPGRGVALLADALRGGAATPQVRQNLALAYALDGRWREAWLMAAQDLPAHEAEQRIAAWAVLARPDLTRQRVAHLLGAPLREDRGYPQGLALAPPELGEPPAPGDGESAPATTALSAAPELQTPIALP